MDKTQRRAVTLRPRSTPRASSARDCDLGPPTDWVAIAFAVTILTAEAVLLLVPYRYQRLLTLVLAVLYVPGAVVLLVRFSRQSGRVRVAPATIRHFWDDPTPNLPQFPRAAGRLWALVFLVPLWLHLPYLASLGLIRTIRSRLAR